MELRKVGKYVFEDPYPDIHWANLRWKCPVCGKKIQEPNDLELTASAAYHELKECSGKPTNLRDFPRSPSRKTTQRRIGPQLRWQVIKRDGFKCRACGKTQVEERIEVDHIIPISAGGTDDENNLQALCLSCNRGKGGS